MSLHYWYMFPISIVVATVAMASGVEGATFFAPIFLLGLGLPPEVAIGTGLITEVFGFASGVFAYVRKRLIDYRMAGALLMVTVPAGIFGSWASSHVPGDVLKAILGVGLMAVATGVLVVAVTALAAASGHLVKFLDEGGDTLTTVVDLVVFTVPGVILGGQLGPLVARRMPQRTLETGLGVLFVGVGLLLVGSALR